MAYENLFHAQVAEGIWLISSDAQGPNEDGKSLLPGSPTANSYLVLGEERALLFDLAINEPGLLDYAKALAGIPVQLVLSHGHFDHIYHLERADEVWMHAEDVKFLSNGFLGAPVVDPCPVLHDLSHGDIIDLGNRELEVIHLPGHTPGSILLLDRRTGVLLSGDTGARRLLYATSDFVPLAVFAESLRQLKAYPFEVMYSAHDRCALPKAHIDLMLQTIERGVMQQEQEPTCVDIPGIARLILWVRGQMDEIEYFDFSMPDKVYESLQATAT